VRELALREGRHDPRNHYFSDGFSLLPLSWWVSVIGFKFYSESKRRPIAAFC